MDSSLTLRANAEWPNDLGSTGAKREAALSDLRDHKDRLRDEGLTPEELLAAFERK